MSKRSTLDSSEIGCYGNNPMDDDYDDYDDCDYHLEVHFRQRHATLNLSFSAETVKTKEI